MEGENQMSVSDILGENELHVWMKQKLLMCLGQKDECKWKYIFNKCQKVVHYIIYVVICMFVKFQY